MDPDDIARLTEVEESVWRPATEFDREYLARLLASDVDEFGRSGKHWSREASIAAGTEAFTAVLPLPHLRIRALRADVSLLTSRSETTYPDDEVTLIANHSPVWQRIEAAWRLRFHQRTPTR